MDHKHDEKPANIPAAVAALPKPFQPAHVVNYNGNSVRVAKIDSSFIWHAHPETDELFYIVSGELELQIANKETNNENDGYGVVLMKPGDLFNVPQNRRHRPVAHVMTHVMVLDKIGTLNTGDAFETEEGKRRTHWKMDETRDYNSK